MTLKEEFEAYNSRGIYPFHMPGHKRNEALLRSLGAIGNESSYSRDYTETEGLDNLYTASGILRESMDKAARLFGSDICWFLRPAHRHILPSGTGGNRPDRQKLPQGRLQCPLSPRRKSKIPDAPCGSLHGNIRFHSP